MSCLKLYAPDDCDIYDDADAFVPRIVSDEDEPEIISWRTVSGRGAHESVMELVARSRLLHRNQRCKECHRPTVEVVQRDDALLGKNRLPVPGSATVVGFHCQYCNHEWAR